MKNFFYILIAFHLMLMCIGVHAISFDDVQITLNLFEDGCSNVKEVASTIFSYVEEERDKGSVYQQKIIKELFTRVYRYASTWKENYQTDKIFNRYKELLYFFGSNEYKGAIPNSYFVDMDHPLYKEMASLLYLLYLSCIPPQYESEEDVVDAIRTYFFKNYSWEEYKTFLPIFIDRYAFLWDYLYKKSKGAGYEEYIKNPKNKNSIEGRIGMLLCKELYNENIWKGELHLSRPSHGHPSLRDSRRDDDEIIVQEVSDEHELSLLNATAIAALGIGGSVGFFYSLKKKKTKWEKRHPYASKIIYTLTGAGLCGGAYCFLVLE